jgi:flagellar protein FliT
MNHERGATQQTQLVQQVFELTRDIEQAVSLADWRRAAAIAEQRSPLLMSIAAQQEPAALAMIRRIQTADEATLADARQSKAALETEYREAMNRTQSVSQYHRVARF